MPRLTSHFRARIAQWLVLNPVCRHPDRCTVREESRAIGADHVYHRSPFPDMTVQPHATVHRVNHPLASTHELARTRPACRVAQAECATRDIRIVDDGRKCALGHPRSLPTRHLTFNTRRWNRGSAAVEHRTRDPRCLRMHRLRGPTQWRRFDNRHVHAGRRLKVHGAQ